MNPFLTFLFFWLSFHVISTHENFGKCHSNEYMCGSTCFNWNKKCHCGGQTFGIKDGKVCCLSDQASCQNSDGKLCKIVQASHSQTWILGIKEMVIVPMERCRMKDNLVKVVFVLLFTLLKQDFPAKSPQGIWVVQKAFGLPKFVGVKTIMTFVQGK